MPLSGTLEDVDVAELVRLPHRGQRSGELFLYGADGAAHLFYRDGVLVHATLNQEEGEAVVDSVLNWKDGKFQFRPDGTTERVTIHTSIEAIVAHTSPPDVPSADPLLAARGPELVAVDAQPLQEQAPDVLRDLARLRQAERKRREERLQQLHEESQALLAADPALGRGKPNDMLGATRPRSRATAPSCSGWRPALEGCTGRPRASIAGAPRSSVGCGFSRPSRCISPRAPPTRTLRTFWPPRRPGSGVRWRDVRHTSVSSRAQRRNASPIGGASPKWEARRAA